MTDVRLQTPEITWIGFPVSVVKTLRTFDYKIKIHSSISYENMSTIWFLYTQIHDRSRSLSRLYSGTSIKSGGVKLVFWAQIILILLMPKINIDILYSAFPFLTLVYENYPDTETK
jgi:hypothetical protein